MENKVFRKRAGVIVAVDSKVKGFTVADMKKEIDHRQPGVHVGDKLHESFYDADGTLKHDGYIKKEILYLPM